MSEFNGTRALGKLYVNLQEKIQKIANESHYPQDDIRHMVFLHCLGIIQPIIIIMNIIYTAKEGKIPTNVYNGLFGFEKNIEDEQLGILERFFQYSSIIVFHFAVENFLKNVLSTLTKKDPPRNFWQISKKLIQSIRVRDSERKITVLNTLGHIRNGFHSNGVHLNNSTEPIDISGESFQFTQGLNIKHTNWIRAHHLFEEIIDIMDEIVRTKEIRKITEKIEGSFVPFKFRNKF